MRRREFIALATGGLLAWPFDSAAARNASGRLRRIGVLSAVPIAGSPGLRAFEQGLRELGWHPGEDITIEYRFGDGRYDRLSDLAVELADLGVELILASSGAETRPAVTATKGRIPIVFAVHGNPIGAGDVESLAHPGGMATGLSQMHPELSRKQLELLRECVPALSRVAVVWNSANPLKAKDWDELRPAAQSLGLQLESRSIEKSADLDGVLATLKARPLDGILVLGDPLTYSLRTAITQFAITEHLAGMFPFRYFTDAGGLMSYGADLNDMYRRAAGYVDKILNGAKPSDLPVEQPVKFELTMNLKTAKLLGLQFPPALLARADEVIE